MTAAPTAYSSVEEPPVLGETELSRLASRIPARLASVEQAMKLKFDEGMRYEREAFIARSEGEKQAEINNALINAGKVAALLAETGELAGVGAIHIAALGHVNFSGGKHRRSFCLSLQ